jgi:hypothetical protein
MYSVACSFFYTRESASLLWSFQCGAVKKNRIDCDLYAVSALSIKMGQAELVYNFDKDPNLYSTLK